MAVWQLLLFLEAVAAVFYQISPLLYFCHISYPLCLGSSSCLFLHLFLSVFVKQLLLFLPNLPSPLPSFVLPMMKLSKSIHYMEYELMIKNL